MASDTEHRELSPFWRSTLICLGYGCFLATYTGVPMGSSVLTGWQETLLSQFVFLAGMALGALALGSFVRRQNAAVDPLIGAVFYAVVGVLCLVAERALAGQALDPYSACALSMVFGLASSFPLLFWYDRLLEVCRNAGRTRCIVLLAVSDLVSTVAFIALGLLLQGLADAGFFIMIAVVVITAVCQAVLKRFPINAKLACASPRSKESYRLTVYSTSMLVCLGAAWGLACCMFPFIEKTGLPGISMLVALAIAVIVLAAVIILVRAFAGRRFGALIRFSVGASGVVLAALPLLYAFAPQAFYPFGQFLFLLIEVSVAFFSINICAEKGLHASTVMPKNYALFLAAACVMAVAFWLSQVLVGGHAAFEVIALLGAGAVAAVILFLPSRESDAVAFTLDTLPENASLEDRMAERRANMVAKYGLLDREAEVLELLFRGMTRQQIADELHLSVWTIKDRVSAIYEKTGAHSYKELVSLIEEGR